MPTQRSLSLGQLIDKAASFQYHPDALSDLKALLDNFAFDVADLQPYIRFEPEAYTRNLVFKNAHVEMICLCWSGHQQTAIHDHGPSVGVARVVEGTLREEIFEANPDGGVRFVDARRLPPGSLGMITRGMIHRQGISDDVCAQAISLHVYSPPLSELTKFDETTRQIEHREALPYSNRPEA